MGISDIESFSMIICQTTYSKILKCDAYMPKQGKTKSDSVIPTVYKFNE